MVAMDRSIRRAKIRRNRAFRTAAMWCRASITHSEERVARDTDRMALPRLREESRGEWRRCSVYRTMVELGQIAPRGSKGLFVLPFVAGGRPHRDAEARGVFFGLRTSHSISISSEPRSRV